MSSFSSFVSHSAIHRPHVSVLLSELLAVEKERTRVWLRVEMDRLVDPMLDSVFNRLQTKLMNTDLARSENGTDRAQVVCPLPNIQTHQPASLIGQPSISVSTTFNPESLQSGSISEICPEISAQVKPDSMPLTNEQVTPQANLEIVDCVKQEIKEEFEDREMVEIKKEEENGEMMAMDIKEELKKEEEEEETQIIDIVGMAEDSESGEDDAQVNQSSMDNNLEYEEMDQIGSEQSEVTTEHYANGQYNLGGFMPIQREQMDTENANGEEIANETTSNQIQLNLPQPNRPFQCSHCPKSFQFRSKLQEHLRVHTGERPFHCGQCDKGFIQFGNLIRHQLVHQGIKRFGCEQCGKQFSRKNNLNIHLRTHSGERPFECGHYEKTFADLTTRYKHEQAIHLHVKPYRCKQCRHTFTQRSSIMQHIRMVHFGLPQSIKEQKERNIIDNRDPRQLVEKV